MKLSFCGNSSEVPTPIQFESDSTDRPKIELIYRGYTYDYTPTPNLRTERSAQPSVITCQIKSYIATYK